MQEGPENIFLPRKIFMIFRLTHGSKNMARILIVKLLQRINFTITFELITTQWKSIFLGQDKKWKDVGRVSK